MDTILQDLHYALRKLVREPGFTLIAIATIAIVIGATTTVYSIISGVLLVPLPFASPERLVRIASTHQGAPVPLSLADFRDYRDQTTSFSGMAAEFGVGPANFTTNDGAPARLDRMMVSPNFFDVLGVSPVRGRFFALTDGRPGSANVAIISEGLWRSRFAGVRGIIGKTLLLDDRQYTVIGVAPRTVAYPQASDVWTAREVLPSADPNARLARGFYAIGRLKVGVTAARATEDIGAVAARLAQLYPQYDEGFGATVEPLQAQMVSAVRPTLIAIFGAVVFVLIIGCANVANLLLVRASTRSPEMAVRKALGAGMSRIVRQLVTESLLLACIGTLIGTALSAWLIDAVVALGPTVLPRMQDISLSPRVLMFAAALSVVTGLLFGLAPALYAARSNVAGVLREGARGSSRGGMSRFRDTLVVIEMALAVVLLVGAGLLMKSFVTLINVDPGFNRDHLIAFDLALPTARYATDRDILSFVNQLTERAAALPGVRGVGVTMGRPLANANIVTSFRTPDQPANDPMRRTLTEVHAASSSFFSTMGMHVVAGRFFTSLEDRRDGHHVLLVNQAFAQRYFANQPVLGKSIALGISYNEPGIGGDTSAVNGEIVGVVNDVTQRGLNAKPFPIVYVPFNALPGGYVSFVARTTSAAGPVESMLRTQVRALDPQLPVIGLATMADIVAQSVSQPRFYMLVLTTFAGVALLLAAIGIYGVISFTVAQRTRELGIRMALGAPQRRVLSVVLGRSLILTLIGVTVGLAAAVALTRVISNLLFGVTAGDPSTFATVALGLLAVSLFASWLPARRAAAIDPLSAMRAD